MGRVRFKHENMVSVIADEPAGRDEQAILDEDPKEELQVGQIYDSLERHYTSARSQSTGTIINASREYLIYKRPLLTQRNSSGAMDNLSLPSMSRQSTRLDSETTSQRASSSAKTLDCRTLQVALTRIGAISPNVCVRAQSSVDRQIEDFVRPLSRHCCEVLGPRTCNQCNQITRQETDMAKKEAKYPLLHVSSDNVTTTIVAERYMPDLSTYQIQHKIGSGDISKSSYHERFIRAKASRDQRKAKQKESARKKVVRVIKRQESVYFANIRDLNTKIVSGEVSKKISIRALMGKEPLEEKKSSPGGQASFSEKQYPMFISPKKMKAPKKPSYIAYYEPPLLPKVCQNAEPSFFAGSDLQYKLPDRLPDDLGCREPVGTTTAWD